MKFVSIIVAIFVIHIILILLSNYLGVKGDYYVIDKDRCRQDPKFTGGGSGTVGEPRSKAGKRKEG